MANSPSPAHKISVPQVDPAWQDEVLRRLQAKATPEPIKVACLHTPPDRPEHLDEGYHGKISKDEVAKLLAGKNGRYLIRESISKPGDLVLSMNFDGDINHYRLLYDGRTYKTDSSESGFGSITELLIHVLELCQKCKAMEENKKKPKPKTHQFQNHTYLHPKWCDICGGFLWGFRYQGQKCIDCGMSVHKNCRVSAPEVCKMQNVSKSDRSPSVIPTAKTSSPGRVSPPQIGTPNNRKLSSKYSCYYYNKSLRFLTQNFSIHSFDLDNNLNKCFCEDCLLGPRVKQGFNRSTSAVNLSTKLLQNWCRFPICPPTSVRKNLQELEVAYIALKLEDAQAILKGWSSGIDQYVEAMSAVPSMAYVNELFVHDILSHYFRDSLDNEIKPIQTVLETFIDSGSFKVRRVSREGYQLSESPEPEESTTLRIANGTGRGENGSATLNPEIWEIQGSVKIIPSAMLIRILRERSWSSPK